MFCEKRTKIWKYKYLLIFWDQKELCCLSREIWKTGGKNNLCKHWTSKFRIDLYTFRDGTKHLHILCKCANLRTATPLSSNHSQSNSISAWHHIIKGIRLPINTTATEREQDYSIHYRESLPSLLYLLFGKIPLIIKQWNTMILIDIIVICNCLGGQYQGEGWNTGTKEHRCTTICSRSRSLSWGWGWRGDGRWKLWRSCFQKLTIILEGMVWMLCD